MNNPFFNQNYNNNNNNNNNFKSSSTYMMQNMQNNTGNFNNVFDQPSNIIGKTNFSNTSNTVHNNLHDNLLTEYISEYHINIDSDDRKIEAYPDPFNYTVTFNSSGKMVYSSIRRKNGDFSGFDNIELPETPAPVIMRPFKNVKFIKLDHVILSKYNIRKYTIEQHITITNNQINLEKTTINKHCHFPQNKESGCYLCLQKENCECKNKDKCSKCSKEKCHTCEKTLCECSICDKYKFLTLRIKELNNNHIFSTNTETSDNTFILYPDKYINNTFNMWIARYGTCSFPNSSLHNLNRLSIEFCNNRGERLQTTIIINYIIKINNENNYKICLTFGKIDPSIKKKNSNTNKIEFKITDLYNITYWYKLVFNNILSHINDNEIKSLLSSDNNYEIILNSIKNLEFPDIIKSDISNNVFIIVGVLQNELHTMTKYD